MTSLHGSNHENTYAHMGELQNRGYKRVYNGTTFKPAREYKRVIPEKVTLLQLLKSSDNFDVFSKLVSQSAYRSILDDPASNVTVFAPTDRAFEKMPLVIDEVLNEISLDDFIAYHIVKNRLVVSDMKSRRFYTDTYARENLLINGMGIAQPRIGVRFKLTSSNPGPNQEAAIIEGDFQANNGVLHAISAPLIAEGRYA